MISRILFVSLVLFALLLAQGAVPLQNAVAATGGQALPITVDEAIKKEGVGSTTATIQPVTHADTNRVVVVFVTFARPFQGKLHVRGYLKDNTEVARSMLKEINAVANEGGHLEFTFDNDTHFEGVTRFMLSGTEEVPRPKPRPAPQKESLGQETKSIVKELLQ